MQKMGKFLDSTPVRHRGDELAQRLDRDGYLFIRQLLPKEVIFEVRGRLLKKAAEGGWLDENSPLESGVANQAAACKDPEEDYMKVFRTLWADEELQRLRTHPEAIRLFERIFGEPVLVHPVFVQRNIFPRRKDFNFTTQPHQDKVHISGGTNFAMWVPLGDCPLEKGSLAVASGSHKSGVLKTKVGTGAGGMDICVPIPGTWVTDSFRAGDVLIFADTTVHQALPNNTSEIRQSFDARYQRLSHPISDHQLLTYAGNGSWEDVYKTWETSDQQYYWRSQNIKVVPQDLSYWEIRDQEAFEMAKGGDMDARDALLRIIQRDKNPDKRKKAQDLLIGLDSNSPDPAAAHG